MKYSELLRFKQLRVVPAGFDPVSSLNRMLFDFQRDTTRWGTVSARSGNSIWYEPPSRPGADCWITTWREWARTAEVLHVAD